MTDFLKKYTEDDPDDWKEWTLDQLRGMAKECQDLDAERELNMKASMLDYTGDVFAGIGVKEVSFEDGPTLDTESKVIRFPIEKVRQDEDDSDSS